MTIPARLTPHELQSIRDGIFDVLPLSKVGLVRARLSGRKSVCYVFSDGTQWWFEWMPDEHRRLFHTGLTHAWFDLCWEPVEPLSPLERLAEAAER